MASQHYVLAVDQGTGSSKGTALLAGGEFREGAAAPLKVANPCPGWVQQDPEEILTSVLQTIRNTLDGIGRLPAALALSTQRESALAWNPRTGEALTPVLSWQDRRTNRRAAELDAQGGMIRARSGLPLDPMFSALKFEWILDAIDPGRRRARNGEIRLGTVDAYLVERLTGTPQIEIGNASRTQLLNIATGTWDDDLCTLFAVPTEALPPLARSDESPTLEAALLPELEGLPVSSVLGDSHAALFAHSLHDPRAVKATYGTGSSIMGLVGHPVDAKTGLAHTIAWQTEDVQRAFEGNVLSTGATLVWLGQLLRRTPDELAELARTVPDSGGVSLVPAFAGLGAPWWDAGATGLITNISLATTDAHLARAAIESIPQQVEDVLERADGIDGKRLSHLYADGGPASNDWLVQRQADISGRTVLRPLDTGLSAIGTALFGGLAAGLWSIGELHYQRRAYDEFTASPPSSRDQSRKTWRQALERARSTPRDQPQFEPMT